jgi:succinate dehydrogenase / fumarate reductase cytochrome b subunit
MKTACKFYGSSLGKKYVMAATGTVLVLFVLGHLVGNLQFFLPPEAINRYAHFLQGAVELLWPVRLILLATVALHLWSAVSLSVANQAARPVGYYGAPAPLAATYASRTMLLGGLIVAAFVAYHLLHYTVKLEAINGATVRFADLQTPEGLPDVYAIIVAGFSVWYVALFYVVGVGALCLHLSHGIQAMFQSLGLKNHVYGPCLNAVARAVAVALFLGYASIPTSVVVFGHGKAHLEVVKTAAAKAAVGEVKK